MGSPGDSKVQWSMAWWHISVPPVLRRLRQEHPPEFQASLGYTARPYFKRKRKGRREKRKRRRRRGRERKRRKQKYPKCNRRQGLCPNIHPNSVNEYHYQKATDCSQTWWLRHAIPAL